MAASEKTMNRISSKAVADVSTEELEHYVAKDYPIELVRDEDAYVASHPDLPGCVSFGEDPTSAVENLEAMKRLWIEGQLASGRPIPEPSAEEKYSGKFVLRIPKGLHRLAEFRARQEGVSLNAYVSNVLAGALGFPVLGQQRPSLSLGRDSFLSYWRDASRPWGNEEDCRLFIDFAPPHHGRSARQHDEASSHFITSVARRIQGHHKVMYVPAKPEEGYLRAHKENTAIK
jgi:predicted RNase H-like HicB family nuclease